MTKLDDQIIAHREKIEELKSSISNNKWKPETNCQFVVLDKTYNIHTINDVNLLVEILTWYNAKKLAMQTVNISMYNGFNIDKWIDDCKNRINFINSKDRQVKLEKLELELSKLLSDDKRKEIELSSIVNELSKLEI